MKTYFVRKAADREVVGLFVASSAISLAGLVDECFDPTLCEYTAAPMGGLMVPEATPARWPRTASQVATGLEDAIFSQQWENELEQETSMLEWRSLAPSARRLLRMLARTQEPVSSPDLKDAGSLADPPANVSAGGD